MKKVIFFLIPICCSKSGEFSLSLVDLLAFPLQLYSITSLAIQGTALLVLPHTLQYEHLARGSYKYPD